MTTFWKIAMIATVSLTAVLLSLVFAVVWGIALGALGWWIAKASSPGT